jgi:hypothetical protein
MAEIKRKKCCNCNKLFRPTPAMLPVRNIVPNPNAAKPVKQIASSVGCKNPRTKTTFADLKTSYGFSSGARSTLDTGAKRRKTSQMRYKIA